MEKPEVEIIRFESGDVIATSAQTLDSFTFSGASDGISGNLTMLLNGEDKTGKGAEVLSYLNKKYGAFEWIGFASADSSFKLDTPAFPGDFSKNSWVDNNDDVDMIFLNNYSFVYSGIDSDSHLTIWFHTPD